MSEQWVVVVRPSTDLTVDTIGPFRSLKRAETARDRIERLEAKVDPWASWAPTVERLQSVTDVLADLATQAQSGEPSPEGV